MSKIMKTLTIGGVTYDLVDAGAREDLAKVPEQINEALLNNQADWAQNDDSSASYIKNRTHWEEEAIVDVLAETTVTIIGDEGALTDPPLRHPEVGNTCIVTWNEKDYECVVKEIDSGEPGGLITLIGNMSLTGAEDNTGEPFIIMFLNSKQAELMGGYYILFGTNPEDGVADSSVVVSIKEHAKVIHKVPKKFLEEPDWAANEGEEGYIKNRTHWIEDSKIILNELTLANSGESHINNPLEESIIADQSYTVIFNGVEYDCIANEVIVGNLQSIIALGNLSIASMGDDTGEPFLFAEAPVEMHEDGIYASVISNDSSASMTISIRRNELVHKIPDLYLPPKTHWEEKNVIVLPLTTQSGTSIEITEPFENSLIEGNEYTVIFNDVAYKSTARVVVDNNIPATCLGNIDLLLGTGNNEQPFVIIEMSKDIAESQGVYGAVMALDDTLEEVSCAIFADTVVHKLDDKFINTPNWNADEGQSGHIKNRTHYVNEMAITILNDSFTGLNDSFNSMVNANILNDIQDGVNYLVQWNGTDYTCTAKKSSNSVFQQYFKICIGNENFVGGEDTGEPFFFGVLNAELAAETGKTALLASFDSSTTATIIITEPAGTVHKLDKKYLPDDLGAVKSVNGQIDEVVLTAADVGAVPTTRTINNRPLSSNIKLTAADVGAATESYVNNKVSSLVDSAPGTLDTLNELAAALGDNPNFATTITNQISEKVPQTRTVNGKALSSNITLSAEDVNAMSKVDPVGSGSFSMNRKVNTVIGNLSHAEGSDTTASGAYSHAEGSGTTASGNFGSHAEGDSTTARGHYSHAEGINTVASGDASHAEGDETYSNGYASHAEGNKTSAEGNNSHAEGNNTKAYGIASHAEGGNTFVVGDYAHAEGYNTRTNGNSAHAEGKNTWAKGPSTHAEGEGSIAQMPGSHTEGLYSQILIEITGEANTTVYTVSEISNELRIGYCVYTNDKVYYATIKNIDKDNSKITLSRTLSPSESLSNVTVTCQSPGAAGAASHAEGSDTEASGNYSHAEGNGAIASGDTSHAEGNNTTANGNCSHAEGSNTTASGNYSHAEGSDTEVSGQYSHAEGRGTIAASACQHVQGRYNTKDIEEKYAHIVGNGYSNSRSNAHTLDWSGNAWYSGNIYIGGTSQDDENAKKLITETDLEGLVSENYVNNNFMSKTNPVGTGSFSMNRKADTVIGNYSHAEGLDTIASGSYSHAEGSYTVASGDFGSHAEGNGTIASGTISHAEGGTTIASGECSHAEGNQTIASGNYSHAAGFMTTASGSYSHAEGSGNSYSATISGEANATTYICSSAYATIGKVIEKDNIFTYITNVSTNENNEQVITVKRTLSSEALQDAQITIKSGVACGDNSHVEGSNAAASGQYSHAEGTTTTASGYASHAEGSYTTASGQYSHAEGSNTTASGNYGSHTEGYQTVASGTPSHAEGWQTTASGSYGSHAEGHGTTASGQYSHAEGRDTIATQNAAHAEGYGTKATGASQHVQGKYNKISYDYAHIVGNGVDENNRSNAHTLDWDGNAWFAGNIYVGGTYQNDGRARKLATNLTDGSTNGSLCGINCISTTSEMGVNAVALGYSTQATGDDSFASGSHTTASGDESHAEGHQTTASGKSSHAEGSGVIASGFISHAEGSNTIASGDTSHAEGQLGVANGTISHIEGYGDSYFILLTGSALSTIYSFTFSSNSIPIQVGMAIKYNDIIAKIIEKTDTTITLSKTISDIDVSEVQCKLYNHVVWGWGAHVEGGENIANGNYSHAEGGENIANGNYSHAEGYNTIASSECQHAQGKYNIEDTANKYVHIVGNGKNVSNPSNAHTLDWSGNAWYQGTVETTAIILAAADGKRYKLEVIDGKLSMSEVTE